jgi:hypothetical protein
MAAGDKAFWADLANAVNPPVVKLVQQVAQSITAAVALTFGTGSEEIDTHNMHDPTTNPSRITVSVPGIYELSCTLNMAAAAYSSLLIVFRKNGANVTPLTPFHPDAAASQAAGVQLSAKVVAVAGDYFEAFVQTTPTGTTAIASAGVQASVFEAKFLRP